MIGPARKWEERRKLLAAAKPKLRIDRVIVAAGEKGYFEVVIEGFGLQPAISPPLITVGGAPLEQASFEKGGRRVTGVLRDRPKDDRVIVDLGYARAESYAIQ